MGVMTFKQTRRFGQRIAFWIFVAGLTVASCLGESVAQIAPSTPVQVHSAAPLPLSAAGPETRTTLDIILSDIRVIPHYFRLAIAVAGVAPILAAIIAGSIAWSIAEFYTKRLKQIEATLEFSKRFHELIQQQRTLNRRYVEARLAGAVADAIDEMDEEDAHAWWWRFFDLLMYEYDFYQKGMVRKARFEEWMIFRWHDYHPDPGREWQTCGVGYRDGWEYWKDHPAHGTRLIGLLEEIHDLPDHPGMTREDRNRVIADDVRNKVKPHGPHWWKRTDLGSGQ
jgi:hypothetical protein